MTDSIAGDLLCEAESIWRRVVALRHTQSANQQLNQRLDAELKALNCRCQEIRIIEINLQQGKVSNSFQIDLLNEILSRISALISTPLHSKS